MTKPETHPLSSLFKAALRSISMAQFEKRKADLAAVPTPWRWPDPKTGVEWSLMARKGELLWQASPAHFVKNHSVALYALQDAIKHDETWRESRPGTPDILLFWLGTMRYGMAHPRTQSLLGRGLKVRDPGRGERGDGGYLDQVITLVEHEIEGGISDARKQVIYQNVADRWLRGCLLRTTSPGAADWRPATDQPLPVVWPLETIERIAKLAQCTQTGTAPILQGQDDGRAMLEQLRRFPPSQLMMGILTNEALKNGYAKVNMGCLTVIEHYADQGMALDPRLMERLIQLQDDPDMDRLPSLRALVQQSTLGLHTADTPDQTHIRRPSSSRL